MSVSAPSDQSLPQPKPTEQPLSDGEWSRRHKELSFEEAESRLSRLWADPPGFVGWFRALQNDAVGGRIMVTAFIWFLLAGLLALLMRVQLAWSELDIINPETYNGLYTMHGSTMMYLFAVPMLEGFAIFLLPIMLGNREMPFPRLGVFSFFTFLMGGVLFFSSFFFDSVPFAGWYAYVPLSGKEYAPNIAMDFWLLALGVAEIGAIAAGVEIIIAIIRMRAPGMTISRMPLLAWALLVTAFSILFAFTPLIVGSLLLELDRKFGTAFFNPDMGGSPILWQHLFWIFGHPEVYIQFIPATGMISMIVPVFVRRPIVGYTYVAMAIVSTGFLSFALWVHHMFTVGLPQIATIFFSIASILIGIPAGVQIFAWLATIWKGRPVWKTPFLFIIGFFVIFILGGITGIMVGIVPLNIQLHDSYFVVAHFHYVLLGGVTFPVFAALYYWMPKFVGKMLDERLGRWHFWLAFIGFNIAFFPMHIVGLLGMTRRLYTYESGLGWEIWNLISTVGAFIFAASVGLFLVNYFWSMWRGQDAPPNPWGADSLEWATASPPIDHGFSELPLVRSRHPLWEQETVFEPMNEAEERTAAILDGMSRYPLNWRAALTTSAIDAKPQEIFRVSGPSIWPFVTAMGVIIIFGAEIFSIRTAVLIGALTTVGGLVGWHWPDRIETTEEELEFEREFGIPVHPNGSPIVTRWAMIMMTLILSIALACFVFSYFFIRLQSPEWPQGGIALPNVLFPIISSALLVVSAGVMRWSLRAIGEGKQGQLRAGLAGVFVLGAAALGLMAYDYAQLDYALNTNAYASLMWVVGGFGFAAVLAGLMQNVLIQLWAWRGEYSPREHVGVNVFSLYWYAAVAIWLIVAATLFGAPYLL